MSRFPRTAATLVALGLAAATAGPAAAWPFGRAERDPDPAPATEPPAPEAPAVSLEQRAQADRLDPLARSVFWAAEVERFPADLEARVSLARALRALRRFDQAAEAAQAVLVIDPTHVGARYELARAHIARGQAFHAIAPLEAIRAERPDDWEAASLLGVALEQVQRPEEARQAWTQALALSPDNPVILTNLALSWAAAGDAAQAEALLRQAIAQPGATLQMRQNLALLIGLQGRVAEAEALIRRDLPPEQAEHNLAWLRRASGTAPGGRTWEALRDGG